MRQKLGIAIAIAKRSPVLILDEPTSGLDPKAAADFIQTLEELRGEGKTILMSTHDIFRARQIADSVGIMKDGHLVTTLDRQGLETADLNDLYLGLMAG